MRVFWPEFQSADLGIASPEQPVRGKRLISTVEVRWFFRGEIPPDVLSWFLKGLRQSAQTQARIDHYLIIADGEKLGLKLREGRIEVKQLQRRLGAMPFLERVAGIAEHWRKWSFALAGEAGVPSGLPVPALGWVGVSKERRLLRYRITGDQELVSISPARYPDQGCDLELTKVRVAGSEWWTLGLEAFGSEQNLQELLSVAAGQLLAATEPPSLTVQDSYGYPRWLQFLVQQKEISTTLVPAAST